jgi:hypothetical protein
VPQRLSTVGSNAGYAFAFDCLNHSLRTASSPFPSSVEYRDPSSPFTVDATLGECQIVPDGSGHLAGLNITIGRGVLQDVDKGSFPLSGTILNMRVALKLEPVEVLNPGPLSELQQIGLLDAVGAYLNDPPVQYTIAAVDLASAAPSKSVTLSGLLAVWTPGDANAVAVFVVSGDLFLDRAVLPLLSAAFDVPESSRPAFAFDASAHAIVNTGATELDVEISAGLGRVTLLSYSLTIAAGKLVAAANASCALDPGFEPTVTVTCPHSAAYNAAARTLSFVRDREVIIRRQGASSIGEFLLQTITVVVLGKLSGSTEAVSSKTVACGPLAGWPTSAVSPVPCAFRIESAGLNAGSLFLKGCWSLTQQTNQKDSPQ